MPLAIQGDRGVVRPPAKPEPVRMAHEHLRVVLVHSPVPPHGIHEVAPICIRQIHGREVLLHVRNGVLGRVLSVGGERTEVIDVREHLSGDAEEATPILTLMGSERQHQVRLD